ncbi:hypothetical protein HYR99_27970 [Candidatus Poribacteria bacterium]|nr:hypothetical protein [Candidatus Poribacteria bacterium]
MAGFYAVSPNVLRVYEPATRARRLRLCFSANGMTGQGLDAESEANEAGNPVLGAGGITLTSLGNLLFA